MAGPKRSVEERKQHRRDKVRENVRRHRLLKKQRSCADVASSFSGHDGSPSHQPTKFVNKSAIDFPSPDRPERRCGSSETSSTTEATSVAASEPSYTTRQTKSPQASSIVGTNSPLRSVTKTGRSCGPFQFPVDCSDPPPAGVWLKHAGDPDYPLSTHHHWLTLLPQESASCESSPCLTLIAHAISLRVAVGSSAANGNKDAARFSAGSLALLEQSQKLYGAALKELSETLASTSNLKDLQPATTLASSMALATYELSDLYMDADSIQRWAAHVNGLDDFVSQHILKISLTEFGRALITCWTAQRAWKACLVACGELRGESAQPEHALHGAPIKLPYSESTVDLRSVAVSLMYSSASALSAAVQVTLMIRGRRDNNTCYSTEKQLGGIKSCINHLHQAVRKWQGNLYALRYETLGYQCEGLDPTGDLELDQLQLFHFAIELTLSSASSRLTEFSDPDWEDAMENGTRMSTDQWIKKTCDLCESIRNDFGFLGNLCGVLPMALVRAVAQHQRI
ncbi:hypothetical protein FH972_025747 [Carpinus fangiana]|uniref:Uncharacterized protein n=1 Tax=Carpinus fangiana TaxID=176857 RepID=A0A5N6L2X2_9ROSI|nr:hypothetical protein FH972_025747 [Carpinus fangiana]